MKDAADALTDFTSYRIVGYLPNGHWVDCPLITQISNDTTLWQGGHLHGVSLCGKFSHVVNLSSHVHYDFGCELDSYLSVRLLDSAKLPNERQLYTLAHYVNLARSMGPTLVHCEAGINRSSLVVALSLIAMGYEPAIAIKLLRDKRHQQVLFNETFESWLLSQKPGQQWPE